MPSLVPSLSRLARALTDHQPVLALRDPPFREAAVALVLTPHGEDADLLLIRRATHAPDPWSGQVGLPGGHIEPDDSSLLQTAIRETREETAVDLTSATLLGALDELRPRTSALPPIIVRPCVFVVPERPRLAPSIEVAELFWAPIGVLFDPAHMLRTEVDVRGMRIAVDAIEFEGRIIWGLTERILRSLQRLLMTHD